MIKPYRVRFDVQCSVPGDGVGWTPILTGVTLAQAHKLMGKARRNPERYGKYRKIHSKH